MRRRNTQSIGEVLKNFFDDNKELRERMLQIRIQRGWNEVLGPMIQKYTRTVYVKDKILYVYLTSSVLRNELTLSREKLVRSLNEYAGAEVIRDIVIR